MVAAHESHVALHGLRILLVEDNFLVGTSMKLMLEELGCVVVGPAPSIEQGTSLATNQRLDGAVLDINIIGGTSAPIAEVLLNKGCPFFFVTGYGSPKNLPEGLSRHRRLSKPVDETLLWEALLQEIAPGKS